MSWWTSEPVAYTESDYEGHRIRLLIAEKRARISTKIDGHDEFPETLNEVDPEGHFPILVDKNLVCYGASLDELIHERYPSPALLPIEPVKRAQVRMLADQVRGWYRLSPTQICEQLRDVEESYATLCGLFMAGNAISVVDIALAPLVYEMVEMGYYTPTPLMQSYIDRIQSRPAFAMSLRSSVPASPEDELNDEIDLNEPDVDEDEDLVAVPA